MVLNESVMTNLGLTVQIQRLVVPAKKHSMTVVLWLASDTNIDRTIDFRIDADGKHSRHGRNSSFSHESPHSGVSRIWRCPMELYWHAHYQGDVKSQAWFQNGLQWH